MGGVKLGRLSLFEVRSWPQGQHDVRKGCSCCLDDEDDYDGGDCANFYFELFTDSEFLGFTPLLFLLLLNILKRGMRE